MSSVLVTGAGGFIGRGVVDALGKAGFDVRAIVREGGSRPDFGEGVETIAVSGLVDNEARLADAASGALAIVHLADNPERTDGSSTSPDLARSVIRAAQSAGVPRIIFASSIYATFDEQCKTSEYGAGKRESERLFAEADGADCVSLRLPPVYGPGGKGGFALVTKLVGTGLPLPFGMAHAKRAYLSRDNLAALVVALLNADNAAFKQASEQVWEPSDGAPVSTAELARAVGAATGRKVRLLPVPPAVLLIPATLAGKRVGVEAVFSSLECADASELGQLVGWTPSRDLVANLAYLRS